MRAISSSARASTWVILLPGAYHAGEALSFAIGCETSAILADALPKAIAERPGDCAGEVDAEFERQMAPLTRLVTGLSERHGSHMTASMHRRRWAPPGSRPRSRASTSLTASATAARSQLPRL